MVLHNHTLLHSIAHDTHKQYSSSCKHSLACCRCGDKAEKLKGTPNVRLQNVGVASVQSNNRQWAIVQAHSGSATALGNMAPDHCVVGNPVTKSLLISLINSCKLPVKPLHPGSILLTFEIWRRVLHQVPEQGQDFMILF